MMNAYKTQKLVKDVKRIQRRILQRMLVSRNPYQKDIRVCHDCKHYSGNDDVCKIMTIINHKLQEISNIKTLNCRTRDDLCGIEAKYYEPKTHSIQEKIGDDDLELMTEEQLAQQYTITYSIDGTSSICTGECDPEKYYADLYKDYNNIYF